MHSIEDSGSGLDGLDWHREMQMAVSSIIICLLSLIGYGSSYPSPPPPPRGCSVDVDPPYRVLCDLESVWGVVLEAVACSGGLTSLVLSVLLLVKLRSISDPARCSGLGPLLLLLATLLGLFTISLAFLVGKNQALCVVRRAFWGPLFALCFSSLLVQGVRLRRLVAGKTSPSGTTLAALGLALALVQGIISAEWVLLTVVREGHPACEYPPLDFALICSYTLGLLLIAMGLSLGVVLCGGELGADGAGGSEDDREAESEKRQWKCNAVWLFLSCLASALLWVAWLGFYLYGSQALRVKGKGERLGRGEKKDIRVLDEPALAVALVIQGWILLLFHAIPEAHLCLRKPLQSNTQDFFDTSQTNPPPHFGEELPTHSHRSFPENQSFSVEEHSATIRSGTYHGSHGRPGIAFRGHVYQPTEMALVMNGGTMPTAPINYTGRRLW
ncbi:G protein-coupled receptor, class C, group 5, member Bb isoform X2 [Sphaeramia orbicularis]|nr:G-protein coupled receptor family C group 5 member B-like isoform X2 [Sphaeramia orbicularis]